MSTASPGTPKLIRSCSIWRTLEVIGDTPTLLILESYWLGARRFDDFCKKTGLLKTVVSDRLKRLIGNECLLKVAYSQKPQRFEYRATQQLLDFFPMALAMLNWERRWSKKSDALGVTLHHNSCGHSTEPQPICKSCRKIIKARDVTWSTGPGVGMTESTYSRRRRQTAAPRNQLLDDVVRIVGDRWATLVLRSLFTGINQFQSILEDTAMATNILSDRLSELSEDGVIYAEEVPGDSRRIRYKLTDKGLDIYPIILTMLEWGDKWLPSPQGPPLLLTHKLCGQDLQIEMACPACDKKVRPHETRYEMSVSAGLRE